MKSAKEFLQTVQYKVPLKKLYKVLASCQYNESGLYCPVIVEIKDKTILQNNNMHPYLLQVWSIKGEMLFEKPLMKPVVNWNISKDRLMFIEEIDSTTFYLVKLFPDK